MSINKTLLCKILVPIEEPGCKGDVECPSKQACINKECVNPCTAISPCAPHASCIVHNTLPLRTMTCICDEGYTGRGDQFCTEIEEIVAECTRDNDCPSQQACRNERCVNPCTSGNQCGELAICSPVDHQAKCTCQVGYEGDPYRQCKKSKFSKH